MAPSNAADTESDEEELQLPADTLKALTEFRSEQSAAQKRFEELKTQAESNFASPGSYTMDLFGEDWNTSQFWYDDETANALAGALLDNADEQSSIAVISAPSTFVAIKRILAESSGTPCPRVVLLEYDRRFDIFGTEFVYYDFASPLRLPQELKNQFDRIICDPPFLSEDCQTKTALTARFLAKTWSRESLKFISCTGERMENTIHRLYAAVGVQTTTFEPR